MPTLLEPLNDLPLAGLMLVVAVGYTVGRINVKGIGLGPAGGTLLMAVTAGLLGFDITKMVEGQPVTVGLFGFALFIYSVGFEAGPRFFTAIRGGPGMRFVIVGCLVNVVAVVCAIVLGGMFELGASSTAGMLSGALTSAATYAAAVEVCEAPLDAAIAFAITFPVGLAVLVWMIQSLPRLLGQNLVAEADAAAEKHGTPQQAGNPELTRAFDVQQDAILGRPLKELGLPVRTGCYITMIHRGHEVFPAVADTVLERRDHLLVRGRLDELARFQELVGPEVYDEELRNRMPPPRRIVALESDCVGKSLSELEIAARHHVLVVGIERGRVHIEPTPDTTVERGDVLEVIGRRGDIRPLAERLGRNERPVHETDIAIYAAGIFLGLLIGSASAALGNVRLTLGMAGGLLLSGILLGRFRRIGPLRTHVPRPARQLVRDLGILLFVAETGIQAGDRLRVVGAPDALPLVASSVIVVLASVTSALIVARRVFRMGAVESWGSIGGGMTSSSALAALQREAESTEPAVSYAAAYAVASVLTTIAGQVLVYLMS